MLIVSLAFETIIMKRKFKEPYTPTLEGVGTLSANTFHDRVEG
jgi:hypothetical protein